jgi:anti-anti-sigma factor
MGKMGVDRTVPDDAQEVLSVTVGPTAHIDLRIRVTRTTVAAVVAPEGEIDSENARQLDATLRAEEAHVEVVLDLRGVSYMSAAAVTVVEEAQARSEQASWSLKIVQGPPAVQQVLESAGLARRARIVEAGRASARANLQ